MEGMFQMETFEHLLNTSAHLGTDCIQVLHAKRNFLLNCASNYLFIWVLQHRANLLCQITQGETCNRPSLKANLPIECASITVWDKTVQAFEECTFPAPTWTSNEHEFPFGQDKGNVFNSRELI